MPWTDVKNKILSLNPSFYSTLGRKDGNIDLSENSYSMLAQGGMVIGNSIKDPIRLRGYGSTEFDGIDDRVVSSYGTRRNLCTNPRAAVGTTGVINSGLASIDAVDAPTLDGLPTGITTAYHCVATGSGQSIRFSIPVVSGNTYHFSFYFRAGGTGLYQLHAANESQALRAERIINALPITIPDSVEAEPLGAFVRADLSFVADSTGTWTLRANANVASAFWVTAVLAEESSALGPYFDGDGYTDDEGRWHEDNGGRVGWTGTPHASPSDMGVFANGTTRTFTGWGYRDDASSDMTLFGDVGFLSAQASGDVIFSADDASEWDVFDAGLGTGAWFHWALVFDEAEDEAELFIDGVSVDVVEHTAPWASGVFAVGAKSPPNTDPLKGKLAHVAVFERALTPEEIAEIYDLAINPPPIPFSEHDAEIVLLNPEEYGIVVLNEEITGFETNTDVNN